MVNVKPPIEDFLATVLCWLFTWKSRGPFKTDPFITDPLWTLPVMSMHSAMLHAQLQLTKANANNKAIHNAFSNGG